MEKKAGGGAAPRRAAPADMLASTIRTSYSEGAGNRVPHVCRGRQAALRQWGVATAQPEARGEGGADASARRPGRRRGAAAPKAGRAAQQGRSGGQGGAASGPWSQARKRALAPRDGRAWPVRRSPSRACGARGSFRGLPDGLAFSSPKLIEGGRQTGRSPRHFSRWSSSRRRFHRACCLL